MACLVELFGDNLLSEDGLVPTSELESLLVYTFRVIYTFQIIHGSHRCIQCRILTFELINVYHLLVNQGQPFDIVFCSAGEGIREFQESFSEMP